jgi:hypothetical protein
MARRPSFQFYPGDWLNDQELQSCSHAAIGLWANLMARMHYGEPYGHLTLAGRGFPNNPLAKLEGVSVSELDSLMCELDEANVFSRTEDGTIFSRRMVEDEKTRVARAAGGTRGKAHGKRGGRPRKTPSENQEGLFEKPLSDGSKGLQNSKLCNPPSSSSSSSSSSTHNGVSDIELEAKRIVSRSPVVLARQEAPVEDAVAVLGAYCDAMDQEHGIRPLVSEVLVQQAQKLVLMWGAEKATQLATLYPKLQDEKLREQGYPLPWMQSRQAQLEMLGKPRLDKSVNTSGTWTCPMCSENNAKRGEECDACKGRRQ